MDGIKALFEEKARLFSQGDLEAASRTVVTPTAIYVGLDDVVPVKDGVDLAAVLERYRDHLLSNDYAHTDFVILADEPQGAGKRRVQVAWRHFDQGEEEISRLVNWYFCQIEDGKWVVALVELGDLRTPEENQGVH